MLPLVTNGMTEASTDRQAVETAHAHRVGIDNRRHAAGTRGMSRGLGVARDPVEDLLVAVDQRTGRQLASVERGEGGLGEESARRADRLHPLAPVRLGGE